MGLFVPLHFKNACVIIGIRRSATTRDTTRVEMIETPICFPINPIKKLVENTKGKNTVIVVSVAANIDLHTSFVPCVTA